VDTKTEVHPSPTQEVRSAMCGVRSIQDRNADVANEIAASLEQKDSISVGVVDDDSCCVVGTTNRRKDCGS
jgi:hypothetical protein